MTAPAIVLVLLLAGDSADPATQSVVPALRGPLGLDDAVVLVQESESPRTEDDALALARQVHALSAVTLEWEDAARTRVRVRVLLSEGGQRYDYELAFRPEDRPAERGRAIGLAMTPVLERAIGAAHASEAAPREGPSPSPQPPPPVEAPAPPPDIVARSRSGAPRIAIDVTSSGSAGVGGNALGVGPALGTRTSIGGPLWLHAVGVARFGAVPAASASAVSVGFGGGVAATWPWPAASAHALRGGLRLDVLATDVVVSEDLAGTAVRRSRWLTAVDVLGELAWPLDRHVALTAAAGAEIAAGPTAVTVGGRPVDTIPVGRALAELGASFPF